LTASRLGATLRRSMSGSGGGTLRAGDAGRPAGAPEYPLAVPIGFAQGDGLTSSLGREQVRFTTAARLAPGERLEGRLRLPLPEGAVSLGFVARVVAVAPLAEGSYAVTARFEALEPVA
jgi:hypothetical protein